MQSEIITINKKDNPLIGKIKKRPYSKTNNKIKEADKSMFI